MSTATKDKPAASKGKIGLLIFLATEVMFFAGLLSAYWVLRAGISPWPPADQPRYPVFITGINTLILLASSLTFVRAVRHRDNNARLSFRLLATALLGSAFLFIQGIEWVRLIRFGMGVVSNIYGGLFYLIVGAHGIHMAIAVLILLLVLLRSFGGRYASRPQGLYLCRIYWLFVVFLWPVIYVVLYLL